MYKINCRVQNKIWIETPYCYEQEKKGSKRAVSYLSVCGLYDTYTEKLTLYIIKHKNTERNLQEVFKKDKMQTFFSIINNNNLRSNDIIFIDLDGNKITYPDLVHELKDFIKENDL